ncbi:MAG TPA: hypothetical protein VF543_04055 [Pyrinomonadaceae bacterium]|jgi:hypothetical protein
MSDTLLSYAISANQDPIDVSPQTGDPSLVNLMILVSYGKGGYVDCQSISFGFLQGTNARDFFSDSTGIATSAPTGWSISQEGSLFTATPETAQDGEVGPAGLVFFISNIKVNNQPGTTEMTIVEMTTGNVGTLTYPLAKFPAQFNVGPLMANPLTIKQGQSVTLSWNGSSGATYELQYLESYDSIVTITNTKDGKALPPTGSYTIDNLQGTTTFYLIVSAPLPGQDEPVIFQREATVSVAIPPVRINSFSASAHSVSMPGDEVTFTWEVTAAVLVQLNGVNVEGNSITLPVNETTTFTLQALGGGGPVTSSITVTVTPVAINSFTATPASVYGKNNKVPVTLAWNVQSASQLLLNGNVVNGTSAVVPVNDATTFTLEATGYPKDVYESLTVTLEQVNLKVWVEGQTINCSFGANVGAYNAAIMFFYQIAGIPEPIAGSTVYQTRVSQPGIVQFSINLPSSLILIIKSVEVTLTGFSSGAITANYKA